VEELLIQKLLLLFSLIDGTNLAWVNKLDDLSTTKPPMAILAAVW